MLTALGVSRLKPYLQWILFFLLVAALYAMLVDFLLENRETRKKQYLDASMNRLVSATEATINTLGNFSRYVFDSSVNVPETASAVCRAKASGPAARDTLRSRLHDAMLPGYELLKRYGFRQFQFVFPDGTSFLRMQAPNMHGDALHGIRATVRAANKTKRPAAGFEEGRVLNGYRFVYPLFHGEEHCGSVELSFSMGSVLDALRAHSKAEVLFSVKRSVAEATVFPDQMAHYSESTFSREYLFDKDINTGNLHAELFGPGGLRVDERLAGGRSFGLLHRHGGKTFLVLFKSMENILGEHVAYIVSVSEDSIMDRISSHFRASLASSTIAFLFVAALSVLGIRERIRLKRLSSTDQLTEILNRHAMQERAAIEIARALRYKGPLSLVLFDIDRFKEFNDAHGHNEGDRVLRTTALTVKSLLRKMDVFGRWGGEEFLVLLPHTGLDGAHATAEKIRLAAAASGDGPPAGVTVSLGVAEFRPEETFERLVERADEAMYRAKSGGRNRTARAD